MLNLTHSSTFQHLRDFRNIFTHFWSNMRSSFPLFSYFMNCTLAICIMLEVQNCILISITAYKFDAELWICWRHLQDPRDSSRHFQRNGAHLCNSTSPQPGNNLNNQECKISQEQFWFNFLCARIVKCQISQKMSTILVRYCKMLKIGKGTNHLVDKVLHLGT